MINVCIICSQNFEFFEKSKSHRDGACSYACLRKTGLVRMRFLKSTLKKRNTENEIFSENLESILSNGVVDV